MRSQSSIICLAIAMGLSPTVSYALSIQYYGKWTDHKGKCSNEEYLYRISPGSFNRYESNCRIVKEEIRDELKLGLPSPKLILSCSSEGEQNRDEVYLDKVLDNTLKIQYKSEGSGFRRLYKCSR